MKHSYFIFVVCTFFGSSLELRSEDKRNCTKTESIEAEGAAGILLDWTEYHAIFKRFGHCDTGAIAEGFSESAGTLLADHWSDLSALKRIFAKDRKFESFILNHLGITIPLEKGRIIVKNAKENCPPNDAKFCEAILVKMKHIK